MQTDTVAALSTARGRGAIAVVRLTGPEAVKIVDELFSGKEPLAQARSHSVKHGKLHDNSGKLIDEVLVTVMRAPDTYTGEDVVEISCHGGAVLSELVLEALVSKGCLLAEPGEFTRRAFLNDRIDLAQAEAVAELVAAKTKRAAERALRQLEGELSRRLKSIRRSIVEALEEVEARIDFPDDVPEALDAQAISASLDRSVSALSEIVSERASYSLLNSGARIPIIGRPNTGKSSLLNAILGRSRVIVSQVAGTTRDTIEEEIDLDGAPVRLIDTAGLTKSPTALEEEGVRRAMDEVRLADFIILVVDAAVDRNATPPGGDENPYSYDVDILSFISKKSNVVVINKIDIASAREARSALEAGGSLEAGSSTLATLEVSAKNGTGISALKDLVASRLTAVDFDLQEATNSSQRHLNSLRSAIEGISRARKSLEAGAAEELVAFELREAAEQIASITGEKVGLEILEGIFSRFCVGK